MPDPGRTTEPRSVASVGTTNASAALTAPAGTFNSGDVGRTITGAGIPAGAKLNAVTPTGNGATLSANATATATITAALGADVMGQASGFNGWSPETAAEAGVLTVASKNAGATDHNRPVANTRLNLVRSR